MGLYFVSKIIRVENYFAHRTIVKYGVGESTRIPIP